MNNKQLKILSIIFIFILILFSVFQINYNTSNYFFISIIIIIFFITIFFYFLNYRQKIQSLIFFITFYLSIFIIEINYNKIFYDVCNSNVCIKKQKEIIEETINKEVKYTLLPKTFIYDDNEILPLSLFSKTYTIGGNENNYFPYFLTDRYGFINNDKYYENEKIDYLILGDSYAMGTTVNFENNLQGNLEKLDKSVISLGMGGNGPLLALASLVEYGHLAKPNNIILVFSETNDLSYDLFLEKKNIILKSYLKENFRQNLVLKKNKIQKIQNEKYASLEKKINLKKTKYLDNLKLSKIRYLLGIENKGKNNIDEKYNKDLNFTLDQAVKSNSLNSNYYIFDLILKKIKEISLNINANLYIFYIPEISNLINKQKNNTYYAVKSIVKHNNINFIDLGEKLKFKKKKYLKSLYPKNFAHPNEKGYKLWADLIINHVSN